MIKIFLPQKINVVYKKMPIKSMKDIAISGKEIMNLLKVEPCKLIGDIMHDLKINILNNSVKNNKNDLKKYIMEKWNNEQGK